MKQRTAAITTTMLPRHALTLHYYKATAISTTNHKTKPPSWSNSHKSICNVMRGETHLTSLLKNGFLRRNCMGRLCIIFPPFWEPPLVVLSSTTVAFR
eukprot:scaffold13221_cov123-Skeletonema_dohrnii-CCMP3373.AAC.7